MIAKLTCSSSNNSLMSVLLSLSSSVKHLVSKLYVMLLVCWPRLIAVYQTAPHTTKVNF